MREIPWQLSAEFLFLVHLFSVSPFAPTAQRSEAESERLSSVHNVLHPVGGGRKGEERRKERLR